MCTKTIDSNIFDLTDNMGKKNITEVIRKLQIIPPFFCIVSNSSVLSISSSMIINMFSSPWFVFMYSFSFSLIDIKSALLPLFYLCGTNMQTLINEIKKLIDYVGENGTIQNKDIDSMCTK